MIAESLTITENTTPPGGSRAEDRRNPYSISPDVRILDQATFGRFRHEKPVPRRVGCSWLHLISALLITPASRKSAGCGEVIGLLGNISSKPLVDRAALQPRRPWFLLHLPRREGESLNGRWETGTCSCTRVQSANEVICCQSGSIVRISRWQTTVGIHGDGRLRPESRSWAVCHRPSPPIS